VTIALGQLRRARPGVLRDVASQLRIERRLVEQILGVLAAARGAGLWWTGPAALSATGEHDRLARELMVTCRGLASSVAALVEGADDLESAMALLRRAEAVAAAARGHIDEEGRVVLPARLDQLGDPTGPAIAAREDERTRWEVAALLGRALAQADAADRALARSLAAAVVGNACVVASGAAESSLAPPALAGTREAAPFVNAAWWRALSGDEQAWVVRVHPEWVGPRDGLPAAARNEANLALLARAEDEAAAALEGVTSGRRVSFDAVLGVGLEGRLVGLQERKRVAELEAVRAVVEQRDGVPRQLLLLDVSGPLVAAAFALGDVDRAEHVATFVGGLSTTVGSAARRYDRTFARMRAKGVAEAGGADLAIVTWMAYPAPQATEVLSPGGRSVLSDRVAREHAAALAAFANGLEAARETPPHQTLWAHSYGSVLGGHALRRNSAFDDVVLFGSPGVAFRSLSEAGLKPGSLNVLRADWDLVAYSGWHLTDPVDVPGATTLSTGWSKPSGLNAGLPATGHSEYLKPGSTSEHNLLAVAIGRPERRVLDGW
jgi:hypothetical protein